MGKLEQTLKSEITRLARKEVRSAVDPLARDVRALKKTARELSQKVKQLEKLAQSVEVAKPQPSIPTASQAEVKKARMSPGLIKKLRKRLGITQAELAVLLDAGLSTVALWEQGRTSPRPETRARLVALRKLGRRDVKQLLADREGDAS